METHTFQYVRSVGWNIESFPDVDSENTLVLIFAAPLFLNEQEPIRQLIKFYTNSKVIGCSTAGEICDNYIYDESLSVAVVKFVHTDLKIAQSTVNNIDDSRLAGESISHQLKADDLCSIFVLSDGLNVNGSELVKGLNTALTDENADVIITGGLAGDGSDFKKTWVIINGELQDNCIVAIGFYGKNLRVGHASQGGWDIFGPVRRVTRSKANVLYELDYKPALQLYKEYLGEKSVDLPASGLLYPLSISDPSSNESTQLVRTILSVDEQDQSLIFAGDIPFGFNAQLMRANFDRLIDSASEASLLANNGMSIDDNNKVHPVFAICISCVGRRLLLGERTEEETDSTLKSLPEGSIQTGFYSYGELSPFTAGKCELHNQTMTITTFYET
ncbi:FIST signal transduction protein [Legionella maioricensis]|uniref:FIST C-terminal domain-containing protein n=1 Tax=Legionella maioricensis TaxID=2896528 RepID=A0A9X2CZH8_9GAMM|nr:FIST N-terminal domain-containing protein [Legionella maioricensis]MCL9683621.1 FIST C-terminal domain-containing protein [Legionella maioricensis]MCL9687643.1 FIST C-terminal domain-containing protein [Legionella maioricensis]